MVFCYLLLVTFLTVCYNNTRFNNLTRNYKATTKCFIPYNLKSRYVISHWKLKMKQVTKNTPKINIPVSSKDWEIDIILSQKINALNGKMKPVLTYKKGDYTYEYRTRGSVLTGIINNLIRLGYSYDEIETISEENNLFLSRSKFWQFKAVYGRAMTWIIKNTNNVQSLWGAKFKYVTDELVYTALLSLAVTQGTYIPHSTKLNLRRMTGIYDQRSITNSVDRLVEAGSIIQHFYKEVQHVEGSDKGFNIYKYEILNPFQANHSDFNQPIVSNIPLEGENISYYGKVLTVFKDIEFELHLKHKLGKSQSVIIALLEGEQEFSSLKAKLNLTKGGLSRYGKKLEDLGIITRRIEGRTGYYSLTDDYHDICYTLTLAHHIKNKEKIENESFNYSKWQEQRLYQLLKDVKGTGDHDQTDIIDMEDEMDELEGFHNVLLVRENTNISDKRFYKAYLEWCEDLPMTNTEFWAEMDNNYKKKAVRDGFVYVGVTF